ncbi:AMP-binding enzyme [Streptomyces kaniharaensis]|uniref:AMP-binding enzyme n=1 Tax=Streptomyces kaniharaensis TaxID=212423 RepID=UPI002DDD0726|nr:hypothetical protein [Streptomyces kaniharaensis]
MPRPRGLPGRDPRLRVELGEIEAALLSHEKAAVVVTAVDAPGGGKRLVAHLTPADAPVAELRRHLAGKLPGYIVPGQFVAVDAFPLTPNRKLDRAALRGPEHRQPELSPGRVASSNPARPPGQGTYVIRSPRRPGPAEPATSPDHRARDRLPVPALIR